MPGEKKYGPWLRKIDDALKEWGKQTPPAKPGQYTITIEEREVDDRVGPRGRVTEYRVVG